VGSSARAGGGGVRKAADGRVGAGVRVGRGSGERVAAAGRGVRIAAAGRGVRIAAAGRGVRIAAAGRGVRIAAGAGVDGWLAAGAAFGADSGLGCELALAAGINVPTGRQLGMPSRQTSAPSPSLPERRARISCSIVIWTNSVPPRSTYQRGLSLGAIDGCRWRAGAGAEGSERSVSERSTGPDTRSSSTRLGCGERLRPRPPIAATAESELIICVASSSSGCSSWRALVRSSDGLAAGSERRSASARSRRTKWPHSQRKTRSLRACSPFVT
jgi:hypothetical protein